MHHDVFMRTTIDLPPDLHDVAHQIAHDQKRSLSDVVVELIRLGAHRTAPPPESGSRGMPIVSVGRPVTVEDARL